MQMSSDVQQVVAFEPFPQIQRHWNLHVHTKQMPRPLTFAGGLATSHSAALRREGTRHLASLLHLQCGSRDVDIGRWQQHHRTCGRSLSRTEHTPKLITRVIVAGNLQ